MLNIFKKIKSLLSTLFSEKATPSDPVYLGFWKDIHVQADAQKRPLYVLAPMADVTDCAFRYVINTYGKPDVTWTEFVSADGLVRATPEGKKKLLRDLYFNITSTNNARTQKVNEHPIVAQLFTSNPEHMKIAAKLVADLGFGGIDINMGCPDKSIEKQGCGSAMIKNPKRAQEIIRAAKEGAVRQDGTRIPVTVKTRIGYHKNELETWLPAILQAGPAVVTIHARTRKEMSKVPARWEHVKRAVEIRDEFFKRQGDTIDKTLIFGNGDVQTIHDGYTKYLETGADGVMIGRGIFGNPWLFTHLYDEQKKTGEPGNPYMPTVEERLRCMIEHTCLFEKYLGDIKSFSIMKKHYKAYVNGFDGAKELRTELMESAQTADDVKRIVESFLKISTIE